MEDKLHAGVLSGRPFGGTAILIRNRKHLLPNVTLIPSNTPRITTVCYHSNDQSDIIISSVYMLYNDRSVQQLDEYELTVGCMQGLMDSHLGCLFVFGGDLNVDKNVNTPAFVCMDNFCQTNKLKWLIHDTSEINYSYHAEVNRHYSLIDHFICSSSLVDGDDPKVCILVDGDNTSDHYAISVSLNMAYNNDWREATKQQPRYRLRWDRADLAAYRSTYDNLLATIVIPTEALLCTLPCCQIHDQVLNSYYKDIVDCLREAAGCCVPCVREGIEKHWWCSELDELKRECIQITNLWRSCGCPRSGYLNETRIRTKMKYKCAIKRAVLSSDSEFNDNLAKDLCNKDYNHFWKAWRKKFCWKNNTPTDRLNGKIGAENVLAEFTSHFRQVSQPNTDGSDQTYPGPD